MTKLKYIKPEIKKVWNDEDVGALGIYLLEM